MADCDTLQENYVVGDRDVSSSPAVALYITSRRAATVVLQLDPTSVLYILNSRLYHKLVHTYVHIITRNV